MRRDEFPIVHMAIKDAVVKALKEVRAEIEEQIDRYDDRNISEYEDCLAIIDRKIAKVKGDKA